MIESGMETFVFGGGSEFAVLTELIPSHHVEHWSWIESDFAMVGNTEGCQNTQLKQQMPDGLLCGQGKLDWSNSSVFFWRVVTNSGKTTCQNLWEWQIPKRWLRVSNIFKWHEILVPSELQHKSGFHSYESQHLGAREVHLHAGNCSHSGKDNWKLCFLSSWL